MRTPLRWLPLMAVLTINNLGSIFGLPVPNEQSEGPTKLLGSSVVTSVSVVTNHEEITKQTDNKMTERQRVIKPTQHLPASPAGFLKPDKFQFYTYDKLGDVVMKQMTKQEIQSLIAAGGGHVTMEIHDPQSAGEVQSGGTKVADVIQNVQNVLKAELSKPAVVLTSIPTIPGHANSEWSSILPSILSGESETIPIQEPEKPADEPTASTRPDERPMVQVPMITMDYHGQDQYVDKPTFDKVNTIPTKPSQHETQDQIAGASENFIKPVVVEKPENENVPTFNYKNSTLTVISQAHTTSIKVSGQPEVQLHGNEKPAPAAVEHPVDKPVETKPEPEQKIKTTPKPEVIEKPVESKPEPEQTIETTPKPEVIEKPVKSEPEPVQKTQTTSEPEVVSITTQSPSTIVPVMLNNNLNTDDSHVDQNVKIIVSTEMPVTPVTDEITTAQPIEEILITKIDKPAESILKNHTSTTEKQHEEFTSTTVQITSTTAIPQRTNEIEATTQPQLVETPIKMASTDIPPVETTIAVVEKTTLSTSAASQESESTEMPVGKLEESSTESNAPKLEVISVEKVDKTPEGTTVLPTESTSLVEESTESKHDEPLPADVAQVLASMIDSIADTLPSVFPPIDVDASPKTPLTNISTEQNITQTTEIPVDLTESPADQFLMREDDRSTTVENASTPKIEEKIIEPVTEPPKAVEVTEISTSTPVLLDVDESSTVKIESTSNRQASVSSAEPEVILNTVISTSPSIETSSEIPQFINIHQSTEVPELKASELPLEETESTQLSEKTTEATIIHLNIIESDPVIISTVGDVENEKQSNMTRIQLVDPLSTVHKTLESSPVHGSTPEIDILTMPSVENQSANGIGSGLIAGFDSTTSQSTFADSATDGKLLETEKMEESSTTIVENITEKLSGSIDQVEVTMKNPTVESETTLTTIQHVENRVDDTTEPSLEFVTESTTPLVEESIRDKLEPFFHSTSTQSDDEKFKIETDDLTTTPVININNDSQSTTAATTVDNATYNLTEDIGSIKNITINSPTTEAPATTSTTNESAVNVDEDKATLNPVKDLKKDSSMESVPVKAAQESEEQEKWKLIPQPNEPKLEVSTSTIPPVSTQVPHKATVDDKHDAIELELFTQHKSSPSLDSTVENLQPDISYFANLCNDLAFSFWKSVNLGLSTSRSLAVSPFGMTSMLAMIFLGARGPTSDQMNNLLKLDDVSSFNPHLVFQNVTDSVSLARNQGIANAAFVRELFADRVKVRKLMPFYKDQAQQFYDGIVAEVNFATISDVVRRRTNLSIRKQTGGRIRDLVKGNTVPLRSPLAAMSANVFQTDCNSPNASSEGRDGELYFAVSPAVRQRKLVPVPATLWKAGVSAGYEPSLDATAIALGGVDKIVSTIFVVPGQPGVTALGDNLDRLEERILDGAIHNGAWNKLLKVIVPRPGLELQVPKFSHRSVINATSALKTMGLQELFDKHADLKGMGVNGIGTDLHLADVLQMNLFSTCGDENILSGRHHVEVYPASPQRNARDSDEIDDNEWKHGDFMDFLEEAASVRTSRQSDLDRPRLKLDRPFLYFVRHNPTGLILHMGRFNPRLLP